MSVKPIITYDELLAKVQQLIAGHAECCNIHIDEIQVYREQVNGANWEITKYRHSGADLDLDKCKGVIAEEIQHLRRSYDSREKVTLQTYWVKDNI